MLKTEAKDDVAIMAEMRGELQSKALEEYFYSFKLSSGRVITGLSYAGVRAVVHRQGHILTKDLVVVEKEKSYIATCKGVDKAKDIELYGISVQPKMMTLKSGAKIPDEYARVKSVAKAQRNALRALIPERVVVRMYEEWDKTRNEDSR